MDALSADEWWRSTCGWVHHACGAADAQHPLGHSRQHAAHGYEAVLILLYLPASATWMLDVQQGLSASFCSKHSQMQPFHTSSYKSCPMLCKTPSRPWGPGERDPCGRQPRCSAALGRKGRGSNSALYPDAVVRQACVQPLLELCEWYSRARHQRRLLQKQPRVREGHCIQESGQLPARPAAAVRRPAAWLELSS